MPNYKVIDADQLDTDLQRVADKLKEKAGVTDTLVFPEGFIDTADAIPSGGGDNVDDDIIISLLEGSIEDFSNNHITKVISYGLSNCHYLKSVNLPNAIEVGSYCFSGDRALSSVHLPRVSEFSTAAFNNCLALSTIVCEKAVRFGNNCFSGCNSLETLVLPNNVVCELAATTSIAYKSPIANGTGYIYVPSALIEDYKAATNWSAFAEQFRAIEDYPEITGGATE